MMSETQGGAQRPSRPLSASVCVFADAALGRDSVIARLATVFGTDTLEPVETIDGATSGGSPVPVLGVVRHPVAWLAALLAQTDEASAALALWSGQIDAFLKRQRRARRRLTLVDVAMLDGGHADDWAVVADRVGLKVAQLPVEPFDRDEVATVYALAAAAMIEADPAAAALADELAAATVGSNADTVSVVKIRDALDTWRAAGAETALLRDHLALQAREQGLLREHLAKAEQEAERLHGTLVTKGTEIARLGFDLAARDAALTKAEQHRTRDLGARDAEIARLATELAARDAALTKAAQHRARDLGERDAEMARLATELAARDAALTKAEERRIGELNELRVAFERKLESQTQAIAAQSARGSEADAALALQGEELALLRENIQQQMVGAAQLMASADAERPRHAALEASLADAELLKAKVQALERQAQTATDEWHLRMAVMGAALLDDAAERRRWLARIALTERGNAMIGGLLVGRVQSGPGALEPAEEVFFLREENALLQAELTKVYGSKSWRVTGPLRAMRSGRGPGES